MRLRFILFFILMPFASWAQTCPGSPPSGIECVNPGANKDITAFTVCENITNNHVSGKPLMVPVATSTEWSTFRSNLPLLVTSSACGGGGGFSPSVFNINSFVGNVQNFNISLNSNCTTGNMVVVISGGRLSSDTVTSMSGLGATWAKANSGAQPANNVEIWYGTCNTAGTTVTVNNSNTNVRASWIFEVSGLPSNALDAASTAGTGGGWSMTVPSFNTVSTNSLVVAAGVVDKQGSFSSISNSYTHGGTIDGGSGGSRVTTSWGYKVLTAAGATSTAITVSGTGSPTSTGIGASFK